MGFLHRLTGVSLCLILCGSPAYTQIANKRDGAHSPVDSQYKIGSGDVLHISVWGQDQFTRDAVVRPDGRISLPLIPDLVASGMTVPQTQDSLRQELSRYVKHPLVTVSIVEAKSKPIYITGEVLRPGGYQLSGPTTALQLLLRAGGGTDFAKLKKAYVLRTDGQRIPVDLKSVLKGSNLSENIALGAGDTVVIP